MSPKRLDDVAPPSVGDEWRLRFANGAAAAGWVELCTKAPGNVRRAFETLRTAPRPDEPTPRHHRLRHDYAFVIRDGARMEHWQYEVTGAGRLWFHIDDEHRTVWIDRASVGHPRETD